jgi:outer membrane protein assembly factor BamB
LVHGEFVYVATGNGPRRPTAKAPYPAAPSLVVLEKRTGRLVGYDAERIGGRSLAAQASSPSLGEVGGRGLVFYGGGDGVCYAFEALSETPSRPAPLKKVWSFDCIPPSYRVASLKRIPYEEGDVRKQPGNANTGSYVGPSEIVATPVYEQKRVYVAIGRDPAQGRGRGALWCIDAARAGDVTRTARIWCYTDIERSVSTVSVVGGMVFAADVSGAVHCVDAKTGKRVWVFQTGGEIRGSTLAVDGRVCVGSGSALWALKAENPAQVAAKVELDGPVQGTPVAANGVLYVASQRHLWAVEEARARREEGPSEY